MLDIKLIRSDPEAVKTAIARRGEPTSSIDEIVELDAQLRTTSTERDEIRSEIRRTSKQVGALHAQGKAGEAQALADHSRCSRHE